MKNQYIQSENKYCQNKVPEFLTKLYELLCNPDKYFNIISWLYDLDNKKFIVVIKDKILVSKILCPRSANNGCNITLIKACQRQLNNYSFYNMSLSDCNILNKKYSNKDLNKINYVYIYNFLIKNIIDILNLKRNNIIKNETANIANFKENEENEENKEIIQIARTMLDLSNKDLNKKSSLYNSNITQKNVLEKSDDENIQKLVEEKKREYLQNLNINNDNINDEENIKICLLIEVFKNFIFDQNEVEKINKKQIELYNYLEEKVLNDRQRTSVLFKCMLEYIKKTISPEKINKGLLIRNQKYDSIQKAQINKYVEDEEMNIAISRGKQLAQNDNKNMTDMQAFNSSNNDTIINLDKYVEYEEMNKAISRGKQLAQNDNTNMTDMQAFNSSNNDTFVPLSFIAACKSTQNEDINMKDAPSSIVSSNEIPWWIKGGTEKALARLHSEPVVSHMIEVYWTEDVESFNYNSHWKLGWAVIKKRRSKIVRDKPYGEWKSVCQIVTQVDYVDGTSVDELLHRGDWKQAVQPPSESSLDFPKYWRYVK